MEAWGAGEDFVLGAAKYRTCVALLAIKNTAARSRGIVIVLQ
jgi:hypothetical protein